MAASQLHVPPAELGPPEDLAQLSDEPLSLPLWERRRRVIRQHFQAFLGDPAFAAQQLEDPGLLDEWELPWATATLYMQLSGPTSKQLVLVLRPREAAGDGQLRPGAVSCCCVLFGAVPPHLTPDCPPHRRPRLARQGLARTEPRMPPFCRWSPFIIRTRVPGSTYVHGFQCFLLATTPR